MKPLERAFLPKKLDAESTLPEKTLFRRPSPLRLGLSRTRTHSKQDRTLYLLAIVIALFLGYFAEQARSPQKSTLLQEASINIDRESRVVRILAP